MTTPTPTPDSQWAVQWEAFAPEDSSVLPERPILPEAPRSGTAEDTPENWAAYQDSYELYVEAMASYESALAVLLADDANWRTIMNGFPDETLARQMVGIIRQANASNPQTRNFRLVWSEPVVWHVVVVE
ncbi:hypothetical protein SEA_GODPHATHER_28 [Mycobacterium phage GodPhather]|uniref:Uncharacterized protein n=1 Tax=Mycobacterium phage Jeon TaxID=2108123 RepID=A0A2P1JRG9_9CAUD|nr:hypothetical protein PQB70_gp27 [Mycobacterium phage Jeon]AVO21730.1 hypothetical protein SEA_JEON_27 [Mycobacterium phage Jeon]QBP32601.1 hypothetical protein SEA_GODPHATHER_28 [Mycobacterium phage GodPhather]